MRKIEMKHTLILMIALLILAACSTPPANTTNPTATVSSESVPTQEGGTGADVSGDPGSGFGFGNMLEGEGFAAVVSGNNVALEFNDAGYYGCENGNTYAIRPAN